MKKTNYSVLLLCIFAFLIPLIGGVIFNDETSIPPGIPAFLLSVFHGSDTPIASHLVLFLPLGLVIILKCSKSAVLQLPQPKVLYPLAVFLTITLFSVVNSRFIGDSLISLIDFMCYGACFLGVVIGAGRKEGPKRIFQALTAGFTILSLYGINEWVSSKATDPSWRIFATWTNPNALATVLAAGLVLACALCFATSGTEKLLVGCGASFIGFALFLTQSRGGLLAAVIGILVLVGTYAIKSKGRNLGYLSSLLPIFLLIVVLCFGALHSVSGEKGAVGSRLTSTSSTNTDSKLFRINLWKGAIYSAKVHPLGTGVGTYQYSSTEAGLTTQTVLAHSNYLQMLVEISFFGVISFLVLLFYWFIFILKGVSPHPSQGFLLYGVLGAVTTFLFDGLLESNFYYFGSGILFFLLLGLGLQLAPDGSSPEVSLKPLRAIFISFATFCLFGQLFESVPDYLASRVRYEASQQNITEANQLSESLISIAPFSSQAQSLAALVALNPTDRLSHLRLAAREYPSSKNLRMLGEFQVTQGLSEEAKASFSEALENDPNNLLTLSKLLQIQISSHDLPAAKATARKMVLIENLPIFKIRSISEVVPIYTVDARIFLAGSTTSDSEKATMILGAIKVLKEYNDVSVPNIISNYKKYGSEASKLGGSIDDAVKELTVATSLCQQLQEIGQRTPALKPADLDETKLDLDAFGKSLATLSGLR